MSTKRPGLEKVLEDLSKPNKHYKRLLDWQGNSRTLNVDQTMITSEGYLFGGFSCFEAAALLFYDQAPQNRFNFEISYQIPVSVEQKLVLKKKNKTEVTGSTGQNKAIRSSTSTPHTGLVSKPKELQATVQGIKELQSSVVSYGARKTGDTKNKDLTTLFHLCCFFDRCTWLLGQTKYTCANFLTGYLSFDVDFLPDTEPLFLEARKIEPKRDGGSSLLIEAKAKDSNSNIFATTKCTLIRVCPQTKKSLPL